MSESIQKPETNTTHINKMMDRTLTLLISYLVSVKAVTTQQQDDKIEELKLSALGAFICDASSGDATQKHAIVISSCVVYQSDREFANEVGRHAGLILDKGGVE